MVLCSQIPHPVLEHLVSILLAKVPSPHPPPHWKCKRAPAVSGRLLTGTHPSNLLVLLMLPNSWFLTPRQAPNIYLGPCCLALVICCLDQFFLVTSVPSDTHRVSCSYSHRQETLQSACGVARGTGRRHPEAAQPLPQVQGIQDFHLGHSGFLRT